MNNTSYFNDKRPMDNTELRQMNNQQIELDGQDQPNIAWLNVGGDSYVANPFYTGEKVPHPLEAEANEQFEEPTAKEMAEWLQVKFEDLEMQEHQEIYEPDFYTGEDVKCVTFFQEHQIRRKYAKLRTELLIKYN